ncbi:hypothetical protein Rsub_11449 [Raphidocelis subcapitata]|uniref:Uncharacterized protein n=1 Tax=Raphidocelis subcapitata TaxID=307507 RepID=A0A2V0PNW0_9CHLO|nr:hypothetical protein Rsub_11449 [Raphidocelis subcapitata]|eukprot:GBF98845.1 hypothetical protein Rsub_11449 [Raphidocelis subcapitata]
MLGGRAGSRVPGVRQGPRAAAPGAAGGARAPPSAARRRAASRIAAGGKGFGGDKAAPQGKKPASGGAGTGGAGKARRIDDGPQAVKRALRAADIARPIDPAEAARGRVDIATVKDWGSGVPDELGDLRVTGVRPGAFDSSPNRPLSAQLADLLAQLEARGGLRLADGGRPLPPFERWSFTATRYRQYLADAAAAHGGLEDALAAALGGGSNSAAAAGGAPGPSEAVAAALQQLGPVSGLHRSAALQRDLAAMLGADGGSGGEAANGGSSSSGGSSSNSRPAAAPLQATGNAGAFASYMASLAKAACSPGDAPEARDRAALRLLACAYSLLASFHSLGVRVGVGAAERAGAAAAGALAAYTDYPGLDGGEGGGGDSASAGRADPAAVLVARVDAAGRGLSVEQRSIVCDELPRAFPKAALIVAALAHED